MSDPQHPTGSSSLPGVGWISFAAALLLAQQIASKATRDALFLVSFDPRRLPIVMIGGAVASLVSILLMSRAMARWGPHRVLPCALAMSAAFYGGEWIVLGTYPEAAAVLLYLHVSALGSVLVSGFWTMVTENRDPHSAKRLVTRVTAAAALGATMGGLVANGLAGFGGASVMLLVLAGTTLAVAGLLAVVYRGNTEASPPEEESATSLGSSLHEVGASPYLRSLAAMSALVAVWQAMLDFAFKTAAVEVLPDEAALVGFFGLFYTGTSLLTFIVQTVFGQIALKRGGLAATLVTTPIWMLASFAALVGTPFALLAALRGGESVLSNSFLRSGYEVLFSPLAAATRRGTKAIVDVAATRVGDAVGSVILLLLVDQDLAVPMVIAASLGVIGVILVRPLTRGYVDALTESLKAGIGPTEHPAAGETDEAHPLSETATALDRERVLSAIAALDRTGNKMRPLAAPRAQIEVPGSLAARAKALTRPSDGELVTALSAPLEPELVRLALPYVARDGVRQRAEKAIRAVLPRAVGSLIDALLDPATPFAVRVRIPRMLVEGALPRAIEGLLLGLEDARLEIRMQCARALARLEGAQIDRERVLAACSREIAEHGGSWATATAEPVTEDDDPLSLDVLVRAHASRSLQYVLVLLSVVSDATGLVHALEGLSSTDPHVRGTALELLDNVVPDAVRGPLLEALEPRTSQTPPAVDRDRENVVSDLLRSQDIAIRGAS